MPKMSDQLRAMLNEYIDSLPWWKRWAWKGYMALFGGDDLFIGCCIIILAIIIIVVIVMYK